MLPLLPLASPHRNHQKVPSNIAPHDSYAVPLCVSSDSVVFTPARDPSLVVKYVFSRGKFPEVWKMTTGVEPVFASLFLVIQASYPPLGMSEVISLRAAYPIANCE